MNTTLWRLNGRSWSRTLTLTGYRHTRHSLEIKGINLTLNDSLKKWTESVAEVLLTIVSSRGRTIAGTSPSSRSPMRARRDEPVWHTTRTTTEWEKSSKLLHQLSSYWIHCWTITQSEELITNRQRVMISASVGGVNVSEVVLDDDSDIVAFL